MGIAKSLLAIQAYSVRWGRFQRRFHRIFDSRDNALAEAIQILEERDSSVFPAITEADAAVASPNGTVDTTDAVLSGVNFIGSAVKAIALSTLSTGVLELEAVLPGLQTITATYTDTGAALAVSAADAAAGTITIVHGDGGGAGTAGAYTVAEVLAVINAHAIAKYMVEASQDTAGDMEADETIVLSGGVGDVPTLDVGPISVDGTLAGNGITIYTDTDITFDYLSSGLTATELAVVMLRADGVLAQPLTVVVA